VRLPFLSEGGERVGSLVLWQDLEGEANLAHLHSIAGELRQQVERKILALWHVSEALSAGLGAGALDDESLRVSSRDNSAITLDDAAVSASSGRQVARPARPTPV
jgi:hypothetical protein